MKKKVFIIFIIIMWMSFIFYNSSNNGNSSNRKSLKLVNIVSEISEQMNIPSEVKEHKLNVIVRKNAHILEFMILAIMLGLIMNKFNCRGFKVVVYIMFICLMYAVLDEFHQKFVTARTSSVSDVLVDFLGSLIGIAIYYLCLEVSSIKRNMKIYDRNQ